MVNSYFGSVVVGAISAIGLYFFGHHSQNLQLDNEPTMSPDNFTGAVARNGRDVSEFTPGVGIGREFEERIEYKEILSEFVEPRRLVPAHLPKPLKVISLNSENYHQIYFSSWIILMYASTNPLFLECL
jgi:hypothetical protein